MDPVASMNFRLLKAIARSGGMAPYHLRSASGLLNPSTTLGVVREISGAKKEMTVSLKARTHDANGVPHNVANRVAMPCVITGFDCGGSGNVLAPDTYRQKDTNIGAVAEPIEGAARKSQVQRYSDRYKRFVAPTESSGAFQFKTTTRDLLTGQGVSDHSFVGAVGIKFNEMTIMALFCDAATNKASDAHGKKIADKKEKAVVRFVAALYKYCDAMAEARAYVRKADDLPGITGAPCTAPAVSAFVTRDHSGRERLDVPLRVEDYVTVLRRGGLLSDKDADMVLEVYADYAEWYKFAVGDVDLGRAPSVAFKPKVTFAYSVKSNFRMKKDFEEVLETMSQTHRSELEKKAHELGEDIACVHVRDTVMPELVGSEGVPVLQDLYAAAKTAGKKPTPAEFFAGFNDNKPFTADQSLSLMSNAPFLRTQLHDAHDAKTIIGMILAQPLVRLSAPIGVFHKVVYSPDAGGTYDTEELTLAERHGLTEELAQVDERGYEKGLGLPAVVVVESKLFFQGKGKPRGRVATDAKGVYLLDIDKRLPRYRAGSLVDANAEAEVDAMDEDDAFAIMGNCGAPATRKRPLEERDAGGPTDEPAPKRTCTSAPVEDDDEDDDDEDDDED